MLYVIPSIICNIIIAIPQTMYNCANANKTGKGTFMEFRLQQRYSYSSSSRGNVKFFLLLLLQERLDYIERDKCEYTLDEEDRKVQDAILNRDPSVKSTDVLKKSLSCSYPNLPLAKALRKESEKLNLELQNSQDVSQYEVIQHLIEVTEAVAKSLKEKDSQPKNTKIPEDHESNDPPPTSKEQDFGHRYICLLFKKIHIS